MPFIAIAAILIFLYFVAESATKLSGTGRIVVGSALAALGFSSNADAVAVWLCVMLGLIIALRGAAYLVVEMLQTELVISTLNDKPPSDDER